MKDDNFARDAVGVAPPQRIIAIDASILDMQELHQFNAEAVRRDRVEFVFPAGLNKPDILDECRALTRLDDFDTMYDLTMQMLVGRDVVVNLKNGNDKKTTIGMFHVSDSEQNLRGEEILDQYPILITWLAEFMTGLIVKKYPVPGKEPLPSPTLKEEGSA
jgi:hypothetical protein